MVTSGLVYFRPSLLEVGADDFDEVAGGFFRGFGVLRHVVADVVLHLFAHQAVNRPSCGGQAVKDF